MGNDPIDGMSRSVFGEQERPWSDDAISAQEARDVPFDGE